MLIGWINFGVGVGLGFRAALFTHPFVIVKEYWLYLLIIHQIFCALTSLSCSIITTTVVLMRTVGLTFLSETAATCSACFFCELLARYLTFCAAAGCTNQSRTKAKTDDSTRRSVDLCVQQALR